MKIRGKSIVLIALLVLIITALLYLLAPDMIDDLIFKVVNRLERVQVRYQDDFVRSYDERLRDETGGLR